MRKFKNGAQVLIISCVSMLCWFSSFAQVQNNQPQNTLYPIDPCTDPASYCPIDDYYPLLPESRSGDAL